MRSHDKPRGISGGVRLRWACCLAFIPQPALWRECFWHRLVQSSWIAPAAIGPLVSKSCGASAASPSIISLSPR